MGDSCRLGPGDAEGEVVARILKLKTFAVVGCSPKPERAGHYVAAYLKEQGYKVVPVNPGHKELLGVPCYPSLDAIPEPVDAVVVFRRSEETLEPIQQAVKIGAKAVWLQDGISNPEGEAYARRAGLMVVSDDCIMRRHRALA